MKRKTLNITIAAALALGLLFSCSTDKNTAIRRAYHNLTAYYNALYNAKDAFKNGQNRLRDQSGDNYARRLNIFYFFNDKSASTVNNDMTRVQEKASKVIKKHSITARPEKRRKRRSDFNNLPEYCKFVDDAYLLKGKAELYKDDYYKAIETFRYIIKEYSMMPIKYDGQVWLARTYLEKKKYQKAAELLDLMQGSEEFPERLNKALYLTLAVYHKKQFEYKKAASFLDKAIPLTKNKTLKYRYHFILAQLYQELGNNNKANENYAIVVKKNPNYEMIFNARINMAKLYRTAQGSAESLQRELQNMLKDDKNKEYRDQIYYALGAIAENKGNTREALKNYRKSAAVSMQNNYQKTEAYLAVADIYFSRPDYKNAQIYYDSAVNFIDKKRRNYQEIYNKAQNLNELVKHINTIERQDSLQMVVQMDEKKRLALIDQIIKDLIAEEKRKAEEEQMNRLSMKNSNRNNNQRRGGGGSWYFYSPTSLSMGESAFQQKWGNRKLEDHWRRSDKTNVASEELANNATQEDSSMITDDKKRKYYLQHLPLTDSAMKVSDSLIQNAYFELANVYRVKFDNLEKSQQTYHKLLNRFPGFDRKLTTYYHLYKIYEELHQQAKARKYKNLIIENYPESLYAQLMTNPEYIKKLTKQQQQASFYYKTTWRLFKKGKYQEVIKNFKRADTTYQNHELHSKFALLNTIAKGRLADSTQFVSYLNQYIENFPNADEKLYAKDILRYMTTDQDKPEGVKKEEQKNIVDKDNEKVDVDYSMKDNVTHFYAAIVDTRNVSVNKVQFNISNFNIDYYSILNFKVNSYVYSANYQIITVQPFTTWYNAMNYYESIEYIKDVYAGIASQYYTHFVISEENYKKMFKTKTAGQYLEFFKENYVKRRQETEE